MILLLTHLTYRQVTGRRDLGDPGTGDEHTLFTCRISVKDNTFYFPKHGLFTGNGVYYRSSKAGDIGGLVNNGLYYVYKVDDNYFQVAKHKPMLPILIYLVLMLLLSFLSRM